MTDLEHDLGWCVLAGLVAALAYGVYVYVTFRVVISEVS